MKTVPFELRRCVLNVKSSLARCSTDSNFLQEKFVTHQSEKQCSETLPLAELTLVCIQLKKKGVCCHELFSPEQLFNHFTQSCSTAQAQRGELPLSRRLPRLPF
jgi:hypothetical protein